MSPLLQLLLMALAASPTSAAAHTACSGFYAYIPQNVEAETPFTVEVQPTAIKVLYMDYSHIFAEREPQTDGSIGFYDNGPMYVLRCDATGATLQVPELVHVVQGETFRQPPRSYHLVQYTGDVWQLAKDHGWPIDD